MKWVIAIALGCAFWACLGMAHNMPRPEGFWGWRDTMELVAWLCAYAAGFVVGKMD